MAILFAPVAEMGDWLRICGSPSQLTATSGYWLKSFVNNKGGAGGDINWYYFSAQSDR